MYFVVIKLFGDFLRFCGIQAEGYLSHLIGHEGAGSLLSLLKERNWVNHLEAGSHVPARGFGTFKIAVDLTTDGLKNTDAIVKHMFEVGDVYLRLKPV